MAIEVYRGAGDHNGQPITAPLLSDDMLIVRGRAEMNAHAHRFVEHSGELMFRPGMRLGQLVQLPDPTTTNAVIAKVTGIVMSIALTDGPEPQLDMSFNVTLRQPYE